MTTRIRAHVRFCRLPKTESSLLNMGCGLCSVRRRKVRFKKLSNVAPHYLEQVLRKYLGMIGRQLFPRILDLCREDDRPNPGFFWEAETVSLGDDDGGRHMSQSFGNVARRIRANGNPVLAKILQRLARR